MIRRKLIEELKAQDIAASTISFYIVPEADRNDDEDGADESESFFGTCDLSGERGDVVHCRALAASDLKTIVEFDAGTWLVHGHLGKLAGAF